MKILKKNTRFGNTDSSSSSSNGNAATRTTTSKNAGRKATKISCECNVARVNILILRNTPVLALNFNLRYYRSCAQTVSGVLLVGGAAAGEGVFPVWCGFFVFLWWLHLLHEIAEVKRHFRLNLFAQILKFNFCAEICL